jgi:hypothetical protein
MTPLHGILCYFPAMRRIIVPIAASLILALVSAIPVAHAGPRLQPKADPEAAAHTGFTVTPTSDPYLMAFHTCALGADCSNPANHLVRLGS